MFGYSFVSIFRTQTDSEDVFIVSKMFIQIYSDIRSCHFLDTNIFGYSFVSKSIRMSHSALNHRLDCWRPKLVGITLRWLDQLGDRRLGDEGKQEDKVCLAQSRAMVFISCFPAFIHIATAVLLYIPPQVCCTQVDIDIQVGRFTSRDGMEIWFEQITSAADERNGTLGVEPRARQLFFQFSPPPLLGFLYMASTYPRAARRGGVRFIRPACVFSVQTMLYTRRLYTCVYTCILRLYTCLVCRQFCIRRLEPSRKNFTAVKTVDVCCPPVFRFVAAH